MVFDVEHKVSYSNLRGFAVWGSSVYRIEIISESQKLSSDFSGVLTLFERRHEVSKQKFDDLKSFINILRNTWQTVLPNARLQEARVARWLEEYLTEIGIRTSYREAFDAMRGIVEEVQTLVVSEEKKLEEPQIQKLVEVRDDYIATGITKSIDGDLTDIKGIEKVLTKFLDDHKPIRSKSALSSISFKDTNSQTRGMEEHKGITDPILDENVTLWTGFNNTFSDTVKELEIVDIIPYCYKLIEAKCNHEHETSQKLGENGLEITWKIERLEPGEKVQIEYDLAYRMMRTILIRDDNDITLLHTYEDIKNEGNDIWIESNYEFREKTNILENVKILDQIPNHYQLISSQPDVSEPLGKKSDYSTGTEIEWTHNDVPVNTQFQVIYDLKENQKMYRDKIIIQDESENILAEVLKLVKPLKNANGYGVIFAVEAKTKLDELVINDRVAVDFKVEAIHADEGNINQEAGEIMKKIKWQILDPPKNKINQAYFRYVGDGKYDLSQFNVIIPKKTSIIVSQELVTKTEKVVLPYTYQEKVDI